MSLFSGGGGLDIGFHDAGFEIGVAVEIDPRCVGVLARNAGKRKALGRTSVVGCDIRDYTPNLKAGYEFVIGGPPCQSFSAAGRRASGVTGINDDRGTLFEEFVRILKLVKPRGFLFENVSGITDTRPHASQNPRHAHGGCGRSRRSCRCWPSARYSAIKRSRSHNWKSRSRKSPRTAPNHPRRNRQSRPRRARKYQTQ